MADLTSCRFIVFLIDAMDSLDEKVKMFIKKCGITPNLKPEWRDEQMAKIKQVTETWDVEFQVSVYRSMHNIRQ